MKTQLTDEAIYLIELGKWAEEKALPLLDRIYYELEGDDLDMAYDVMGCVPSRKEQHIKLGE